jgi:hypothetical protein
MRRSAQPSLIGALLARSGLLLSGQRGRPLVSAARAAPRVGCWPGSTRAERPYPVEIWPEEAGLKCRVTMRYTNGTLLKIEGKNRGMEDLGAVFIRDNGLIGILRGDYDTGSWEMKKPTACCHGRAATATSRRT